jgi:hypothetical protein
VVGGQRKAVGWAYALGLAQAERRRDPQLKAQPDHQPVDRTRPAAAAQRARQRSERGAAARAESPVGGLNQPRTLPARRASQQSTQAAGALATERVRRSLLHQPELARHHVHAGHRHRPYRPARGAMEDVAHVKASLQSLRFRCGLGRLRSHRTSLLRASQVERGRR